MHCSNCDLHRWIRRQVSAASGLKISYARASLIAWILRILSRGLGICMALESVVGRCSMC